MYYLCCKEQDKERGIERLREGEDVKRKGKGQGEKETETEEETEKESFQPPVIRQPCETIQQIWEKKHISKKKWCPSHWNCLRGILKFKMYFLSNVF